MPETESTGLREPFVGVIVAAGGETPATVARTVRSVLDQDWPHDRLAVVVSDAAADPDLEEALAGLPALYHVPPPGWSPGNSALELLRERFPQMVYVELRDAGDDLRLSVFLRLCVERLEHEPWLSFAQAGSESAVVWRDATLERVGDFPAFRPVAA
jgi:cellulose synthase (UDP-forming)